MSFDEAAYKRVWAQRNANRVRASRAKYAANNADKVRASEKRSSALGAA